MFAKPKSRVSAQAAQTAQALHTSRALGTAPVGPLHRPAIRNGKGAHVAALALSSPSPWRRATFNPSRTKPPTRGRRPTSPWAPKTRTTAGARRFRRS